MTWPGASSRIGAHELAVEVHVRVYPVLEHEEVALHRELGQTGAPLVGEAAAGRVLAGALEPDELHLVAGEQALEPVDVDAVLVHGHPDHARPRRAHGGHHPDERGRLDDRHVARLEDRPRRQRDRLLGAGSDHDLVGVLGPAVAPPARGELLAQLEQALGGQVRERLPADLLEHVGGDRGELLGRVVGRRGPADGERDEVVAPRVGERVGEDLLGVREVVGRQRVDLPVVPVGGAAGWGQRPHEGAAADLGGDVAELGELAVDARGGQVVDARLGSQLARRAGAWSPAPARRPRWRTRSGRPAAA